MSAEKDESVFSARMATFLNPFNLQKKFPTRCRDLYIFLFILARCLTVTARRDNHFTAPFCQILNQHPLKRLIRQ